MIVFQYLAMYLFNPFTLWFVTTCLVMWGVVKLFRRKKEREVENHIAWVFLFIITPIISTVVFFAAYNGTVNNFPLHSRVNVSSIAELSTEQVYRVHEILGDAMRVAFDRELTIEERINDLYTSSIFGRDDQASLSVRITVYQTFDSAVDYVQRLRNSYGRLNHRFTELINDNHTEAVLRRPFMETSASGLHLPNPERITRTHVRIGRVVIRMTETHLWYYGRPRLSEYFITTLVEMLQYELD